MRIQNNLKYDIFLPYAGSGVRGVVVRAGKHSSNLPSSKFNDPLLQRDLKRKRIGLVLSDDDRKHLGILADELINAQVPAAKPVVKIFPSGPASDAKKSQVPANQQIKVEKKPLCVMCGRDKFLSMDPDLHDWTCQYCNRNKTQLVAKGKEPSAPETPPPEHLTADRPIPPSRTQVKQTMAGLVSQPSSGVPAVAEPARKPLSLAELMKKNNEVTRKKSSNAGVGAANTVLQGPLAYMEQDNLAKEAQKATL